jgi:formylglycine-generating enzyme required for sulfatase activity
MSAQASGAIKQLLPDFVALQGGVFLMGTPVSELSALAKRYGGTRESYREESPQHQVVVAPFAIARTPTTHALYAAYVAATGARAPLLWRGAAPPDQLRDHPVVDISWEEANAFCAWLAEQHVGGVGHGAFRLPTEAEWEYAARGADGRSFPWGEEFATRLANTREGALASTTPVAAYPDGASPHGVYDMAGNVWEWTASLDALYPYQSDDGREGAGPGRRIMRGGCYANPHGYARCACRFRLAPGLRNEFTGFRLAVSLPAQGSVS